MGILIWLLRVAIFILAFLWARANQHLVEVFLGSVRFSLPLSILLLTTLFAGVLIGIASAYSKGLRAGRKGV